MEKKKGLLEKLFGKKEKQNSCCCAIELEEVKDDQVKGKENEEKPNCCKP